MTVTATAYRAIRGRFGEWRFVRGLLVDFGSGLGEVPEGGIVGVLQSDGIDGRENVPSA